SELRLELHLLCRAPDRRGAGRTRRPARARGMDHAFLRADRPDGRLVVRPLSRLVDLCGGPQRRDLAAELTRGHLARAGQSGITQCQQEFTVAACGEISRISWSGALAEPVCRPYIAPDSVRAFFGAFALVFRARGRPGRRFVEGQEPVRQRRKQTWLKSSVSTSAPQIPASRSWRAPPPKSSRMRKAPVPRPPSWPSPRTANVSSASRPSARRSPTPNSPSSRSSA